MTFDEIGGLAFLARFVVGAVAEQFGHFVRILWTLGPRLVGSDDHVGHDKEGPVFGGRHDVVSLVPDALIHVVPLRRDASAGGLR